MPEDAMAKHALGRRSVDRAPPAAKPRWLGLAVIAVLAAVVIGVLQAVTIPDGGTRNLAIVSAIGVALAALLVWLLFFATLRWRGRLILLAAVALLAGSLRLEGYSGDLQPVFGWRWSQAADRALVGETAKAPGADTAQKLDLRPTPHDFPQFLGPARLAEVDDVRLATDWRQAPPRQLWRQPIGAGWSSFAVVGNYAFTQEQRGDDELVVCYRRDTGALVWSHAARGRFESVMGGDGPRATPTLHAGRLYAIGATGWLKCLDGNSGRVLWSRDIVTENHAAVPMWGISGSPLVVDGRVIVSAGGPDGHSLVAYHPDTGDVLWHGGDSRASYASPVLATINGQRQIVMLNAEDVTGHDLETGHVLWQYTWPGSQPKVPQPVAIGDHEVLIAAGYGLGSKLLNIATGKPTSEAATEVWSSRSLRPKFTNVIVLDKHIYGIDDGRTLNCLDLASGKLKWRSARSAEYGHGQVLRVGKLLVVQCESGDVALVRASPERFEELSRFHAIEGKTWNNPALSGAYLLVRNAQEAACYALPQAND
jgi:outer membrane protein assembly factor BamB